MLPTIAAETQGHALSVMALKRELDRQGCTFDDVAGQLHRHRGAQIATDLYPAGFVTRHGSAAEVVMRAAAGRDHHCILWSVNHYTGLNRDDRVIQAAQRALATYGTGAGTSAMSGGLTQMHQDLRETILAWTAKPDVLLFPTGFSANYGGLSTLPQRGDLVLFDRECHASIIAGLSSSSAQWRSFRHNDVDDLARRLARADRHPGRVFVVVESAYSMSGDLCPLRDIARLKDRHRFLLYVDEAHTFGFYGPGGRGYCAELGLTDDVDFLMSTLSKATASLGGFLACAARYRPLLEWGATSYIFQACTSPADAAAALESMRILEVEPGIARRIHRNNAVMRRALTARGFDLRDSRSPIVPLYVGHLPDILERNRELIRRGVFTPAVPYPAVKRGGELLRFIVTAAHTEDQIARTVDVVDAVFGPDGSEHDD